MCAAFGDRYRSFQNPLISDTNGTLSNQMEGENRRRTMLGVCFNWTVTFKKDLQKKFKMFVILTVGVSSFPRFVSYQNDDSRYFIKFEFIVAPSDEH